MVDLSVVIPTFNERKNIEILIPGLEQTLQKAGLSFELIIVDDNSPDHTFDSLVDMSKKYNNIVAEKRIGKKGIASAWFHGYTLAKGKYIATMDADLCHDPKDLLKLYLSLPEADIIIGSRYIQGGSGMHDKSFIGILASKIAQMVTRVVLGMKGHDLTHSFRIFKKEVFYAVKDKVNSEGNVFLVEFLYYAKKKGYTIKEIPITYGVRKYGQTKLNVYVEGIRFFFKAIKIFIQDKIS